MKFLSSENIMYRTCVRLTLFQIVQAEIKTVPPDSHKQATTPRPAVAAQTASTYYTGRLKFIDGNCKPYIRRRWWCWWRRRCDVAIGRSLLLSLAMFILSTIWFFHRFILCISITSQDRFIFYIILNFHTHCVPCFHPPSFNPLVSYRRRQDL